MNRPQVTIEVLEQQAAELLERCKSGDKQALAIFAKFGPEDIVAQDVSLEMARAMLAKNFGMPSWERLTLSLQMVNALFANDIATVQGLIEQHPALMHENARGSDSNWGAPMSFAANLGHDDMIRMLAEKGAQDFQHAFGRACLQGQVSTAKLLMELGATIERGVVMGPCETLNADGLGLLLELGAEWSDEEGNALAPVAMLLQTYTRDPEGKHRCLKLAEDHGVEFPDTPLVALHRGRTDLLEKHLQSDPDLIHRAFSLREVYPLELGCHDDITCGLHGTSLAGTTLLHMCVDFDEMEIAQWLLENGADANARAKVDQDGFGGHTPLFNAVVSQANLCGRQKDATMAKLLLSHGADPTVRTNLCKQIRFWEDETMHAYYDVTPASYGRQFHAPQFVNPAVLDLLK